MRSVSRVLVAACFVWIASTGCSSCRDPAKARGARARLPAVVDRPAVLAELPDAATAPSPATPQPGSTGEPELIFADRGGGVAWVASQEGGPFRVVHNGRPGTAYAAVGDVVLSPDGGRFAYGALVDGAWRMVVDGKEGPTFAEVASPVFSPDGAHLAYQAKRGERWHLVVDSVVNGGTATRYAMHALGGDPARVVFLDEADEQGWGRLVVSDLAFERQTVVDARASSVYLNAGASTVAAVAAAGEGQQVLTFPVGQPDEVKRAAPWDAVHNLVFGSDGASVAYLAERGGQFSVVLDERQAPFAPGDDMISLPVVGPDRAGLAALVISSGAGVTLRRYFVEGVQEGTYEGAEGLAWGAGGHAYAAHRGERWFVVANGKEGPTFDRVVNPAFSPDGRFLVYRARKDGKRFVVVADREGKTIRQHPEYEQVFPVRFTADGRSIAYGVKDGRRLAWKVEPL